MTEPYLLSTFSGKQIDLGCPQPDQISLEDIASALSKICRFGAQTREFLSVAQHAVLVQMFVVEAGREDLARATLHHDSHEAYVCDIPTPVKRKLGMDHQQSDYANLAGALDVAILRALDFLPITDRDDVARVKASPTRRRSAPSQRPCSHGSPCPLNRSTVRPANSPCWTDAAFATRGEPVRVVRRAPR